jgi:phosphoribosylformylglycinamidine synthase
MNSHTKSNPHEKHTHTHTHTHGQHVGLVLEVRTEHVDEVIARFTECGVSALRVANTTAEPVITIHGGAQELQLRKHTRQLRDVWEATGFELERRQANPVCVLAEQTSLKERRAPQYSLKFTPKLSPRKRLSSPPR